MTAPAATELILIRHAPALAGGRLCGRTDVAADLSDPVGIAALAAGVGAPARLIASPALRCRQTAAALWPGQDAPTDERLWEQDFGAWDGLAHDQIPDLGSLAGAALADHRPPRGESFADVCRRIGPALAGIAVTGPATIVAHAGTVRAALALALGAPAPALGFEVAPLSATRLARLSSGDWVIRSVNWTPAR